GDGEAMADLTLRGQHQEAQELVNAGRVRDAVAICSRILQSFPRHILTYSTLGQAYLGMGDHEEAANLFRRVLSADPEHALAYASLSAIYVERGLIEEATWQMERAFELSPRNGEIRREVRELYGRLGAARLGRIKMTRAALARGYLRGQLFPKAIGELRDLIEQAPYRYDLRVVLAEALWHDRRREECAVVCQGILGDLPNCLKANLILGQLWLNTGRDEQGRALLQRCQALDPDNGLAQALFGERSPLPPRISRLPFRAEDAPPLDLPYPLEDDSAEPSEPPSERQIVDAGRAPIEPAEQREWSGLIRFEHDDFLSDLPAGQGAGPEGEVRSSEGQVGTAPSMAGTSREAPDPDDYHVRLGLARHFRDEGILDAALRHYARLIEQHSEADIEVAADLELLQALYPANKGVEALLMRVRQRLSRDRGSAR
ncbi:MAG: tetratricopeptide repeat protein, partial [Anaerolineae bacterium]|nr:tetratricopeptide repeat protein [Anaerolineae bacterium]